ncbi:hypothetical protein SADUNF_Sadunf06G0158900 [Salix dunnii]|uniref:Uncharacterized protein n=1 Tax=Salix dunnii TaxID=1413687 RepID=A0A835N350_9ROSI|nr:hypothetical protein SADUNF_Sadunf06G0158900 [Salix dunnii]
MKREHQETIGGAGSSNGNKAESFSSSMATGKGKLWVEDDQDAGGMDELLAVLGYKIKSNLRSCGSFCAEERKGMRRRQEDKCCSNVVMTYVASSSSSNYSTDGICLSSLN